MTVVRIVLIGAIAALLSLAGCAAAAPTAQLSAEDAFWEQVLASRPALDDSHRNGIVERGRTACARMTAGEGPAYWEAAQAAGSLTNVTPQEVWDAAVAHLCPDMATTWSRIQAG